jgi:hypothetical protein
LFGCCWHISIWDFFSFLSFCSFSPISVTYKLRQRKRSLVKNITFFEIYHLGKNKVGN